MGHGQGPGRPVRRHRRVRGHHRRSTAGPAPRASMHYGKLYPAYLLNFSSDPAEALHRDGPGQGRADEAVPAEGPDRAASTAAATSPRRSIRPRRSPTRRTRTAPRSSATRRISISSSSSTTAMPPRWSRASGPARSTSRWTSATPTSPPDGRPAGSAADPGRALQRVQLLQQQALQGEVRATTTRASSGRS